MLKDYIEQNLFAEKLLPKFPFLKKGWDAHVISGDGGIDEKDFKLLKICIDQFTHDSSIKCCLTTFYTEGWGPEWLPEWETTCNWAEFREVIDSHSAFTYSGMYFFGSSEKWGGFIIEGELIIIGGEFNFIKKFESLSNGYLSLKSRFDKECLRKTYALHKDYLMELRETFYSR